MKNTPFEISNDLRIKMDDICICQEPIDYLCENIKLRDFPSKTFKSKFSSSTFTKLAKRKCFKEEEEKREQNVGKHFPICYIAIFQAIELKSLKNISLSLSLSQWCFFLLSMEF